MKVQCTECGIIFYRDSSSPTYTLCDKCYKELVERGTPIAPVAATASLRFTGEVFDGETISLGQNTYEFDIGGTIRPGNILIDISGDAVAATGYMTATAPGLLGEKIVINEEEYVLAETDGDNDIDVSGGTKTQAATVLTLTGAVKDGETFTIGEETYEIDTDDNVTEGNIAVDVSAYATAAQGTLTVTGGGNQIAEGYTVTIDGKTYTFKTSLTVEAVEGEVLIGANDTAALLNLLNALNHTGTPGTDYSCEAAHPTVKGSSSDATTLVVEARTPGTAGNAIEVSKVGAETIWDDTVLGKTQAGVDCTAENADGVIITAFNAGTDYDITASQGSGTSVDFSADAEGAQDGSAGNAIDVSTTISNGSFDGDNLAGGTDATADEIVAAAVVTINAKEGGVVSATDETGGVLRLTAVTAGVAGNEITTTTDITGASFAEENLTGGIDAGPANAVTATVAAINGNASEKVTAIDDAEDVVTITAKTIGTYGNYILLESTCENASWDGSKMTGGVNGSPALRDQIVSDENNLHISHEPSTYQESKWKKTDLT